MHSVAPRQQPPGASQRLGKSLVTASAQQAATARSGRHDDAARCGLPKRLRGGKHCLRPLPLGVATPSEGQFHGRAALGRQGQLRPRRAGGAGNHHRGHSTAAAVAGLLCLGLVGHHREACYLPPAPPNRSFKGTRNGMSPRPCSRLCISSAARPGRHAAARPLTLR
jgi:hypothetical protein